MNKTVRALALLAALFSPGAAQAAESGWIQLFDGRSLEGHIGLQIHPGGGLHVRFKEIQVRPRK